MTGSVCIGNHVITPALTVNSSFIYHRDNFTRRHANKQTRSVASPRWRRYTRLGRSECVAWRRYFWPPCMRFSADSSAVAINRAAPPAGTLFRVQHRACLSAHWSRLWCLCSQRLRYQGNMSDGWNQRDMSDDENRRWGDLLLSLSLSLSLSLCMCVCLYLSFSCDVIHTQNLSSVTKRQNAFFGIKITTNIF